jgi:hypothetical protein
MSDNEDVKYSIKVPSFDGTKDNWLFYKVKMESYLAQKDMVELLTWDKDVPKDSTTWTNDELKDNQAKLAKKVKLQNRKAAGILLGSIQTDSDSGKAAFHLVEKFMNKNEGYAGGNFKKAWAALEKRFKERDTISKADLKQGYYDLKMKVNEQPALFIVKLERMKQKLEDHGHKISDEDFLTDILAKVPKGTSSENLGPYQIERRLIESRMKIDRNYALENLVDDLEKVFMALEDLEVRSASCSGQNLPIREQNAGTNKDIATIEPFVQRHGVTAGSILDLPTASGLGICRGDKSRNWNNGCI